MPFDFRADQIRTTKLIATGSNNRILVYSYLASTDLQGSAAATIFNSGAIGSDVFFFVSGASGSLGTSTKGVSLFGGDTKVSGAFEVGSTNVIRLYGNQNKIQFNNSNTEIFLNGNDLTFKDPNNTSGWTLAQLATSGAAGGGSGDSAATYLVVSLTSSLSAERQLAAGPGIVFGDLGAGAVFGISGNLGAGPNIVINTNGAKLDISSSGLVSGSRAINTTSPLQGGGALTGDLTLSILTAGSAQAGAVSTAAQSFGGIKTFDAQITASLGLQIGTKQLLSSPDHLTASVGVDTNAFVFNYAGSDKNRLTSTGLYLGSRTVALASSAVGIGLPVNGVMYAKHVASDEAGDIYIMRHKQQQAILFGDERISTGISGSTITVSSSNGVVMKWESNGIVAGANLTKDNCAVFQVNSTTQGAIICAMTTNQREAISSPTQGLMVYDTDFDKYYYYNGTIWQQMGSSAGTYVTVDGTTPMTAHWSYGAFGLVMGESATAPSAPSALSGAIYMRSNGLASPNQRTQLVVKWPNGDVSVVAESAAS